MIVLGLDISLNAPGWCRIDTETGARTYDTLHFDHLKGMERIAAATKALVELCRPADLVVMEGLSMGLPTAPGGRPFIPQGRYDMVGAVYVVRLWLYKTEHRAILVPPAVLKKWATGKGNSPKSIMIHEVAKRWGVEPADDNQADSIALAEFGRSYVDGGGDLSKVQKSCLERAEKLYAWKMPDAA